MSWIMRHSSAASWSSSAVPLHVGGLRLELRFQFVELPHEGVSGLAGPLMSEVAAIAALIGDEVAEFFGLLLPEVGRFL
ncbi:MULTISPECIES: hypothetical protein [unclassified Streptomyces]|uniref:hypothetical protein n=1 Tax=Streptomyces sp. SID8379 TaxID=2690359 RepID=UPI0006888A85|nr:MULTISPECIES: hypothetical protein [unclassified Streptomyces]